ncbi:MAG: endonuclease III [Angelakisella sp.]
MNNKQRAAEAINRLEARYPDAACSLTYTVPHELLIATRLSAQCTDARVNMVTPALFASYPTIADFAEADVQEVEALVRTCGFYHTKAQDIVGMCRMIITDFAGKVPDNMEDLLKLPGVGRKTANLVLGDIFGKPAIVCDTHCIRITNLLGLTTVKDPAKVEAQLRILLPSDKSNDFCHRLVLFGREICIARRPKCEVCPLSDICKSGNVRKNPPI